MEHDTFLNKNSYYLKLLSVFLKNWKRKIMILLAAVFLLFVPSVPAAAAVEGFLAKDSDGSYHQYCYEELLSSYAQSITGLADGLYEDFALKKPVALLDCAQGYIDYSALLEYYAGALMRGESFDLVKYTEKAPAPLADLPRSVSMVSLASGKIVRVEKNIEDNKKDEEKDANGNDSGTNNKPGQEKDFESTPIVSASSVSLAKAQKWALNKGAHRRYIEIAPLYWEYGSKTGIRPEALYAQAALETGFGYYRGLVPPEYNNWAGIKVGSSNGNNPEDHQQFASPEDGVRAHFNHVSAYVGLEPIGEPHDRYYLIIRLNWAGTVETVEGFSGKWAPSPVYHERIVGMIEEMEKD